MALVVLVLLGAAALGAGAGAVRRQLIAKRTAAAHHRALDTMARLVAQHNGPAATPPEPVDPSHPHVRLVRTDQQPAPTVPPVLRSRPKRGRASAYQRAGRGFDAPAAAPAEPVFPPAAPAEPVFPPAAPAEPVASAAAPAEPVFPPAAPAEPVVPAGPALIRPPAPVWPEPAALAESQPPIPAAPAESQPPIPAALAECPPPIPAESPPPIPTSSATVGTPVGTPPIAATPRVFDATDDLPPPPPAAPIAPGPPRSPSHSQRSHRPGRSPLGRATRSRRFHVSHRVTATAAALVIAGGIAAGFVLSGSPDHATPPAHRSAGQQKPAARPPPNAASSATTNPTAPTASDVSLVASSAGYSVYRLSWPATIRLESTGLCWIEIREAGPSGPVTFQGDLTAGASHAVTGPSWLRLGNPTAVAVTVNGRALTPPLVAGEPYNIQFS